MSCLCPLNLKYSFLLLHGSVIIACIGTVRNQKVEVNQFWVFAFIGIILAQISLRSVQTMQLFSLGQGTVSLWSIVPLCPRVLQKLPTMSDSWDSEIWGTWELSYILLEALASSNTLRQRGTMLHGDTVPCPKEKSCIVWTDLYAAPLIFFRPSCFTTTGFQIILYHRYDSCNYVRFVKLCR